MRGGGWRARVAVSLALPALAAAAAVEERHLQMASGLAFPAPAAAVPVEKLHVEMDPGEAEDLNDREDDTSVPMTIADRDVHLPGRIEVKGSFTKLLKRKSFVIKLDPGLQWQGESRIVVDSRASDPTLMRDWLGYDLWRALGMVGPQARYLDVSLNGESRGPFLQVGWIGADLFQRRGLGADGELYTPPDQIKCGDLSLVSLQTLQDCWRRLLPAEGNDDALRELVTAIDAAPDNRFHEVVDRYFDAESVINWFVLNTVISNGDTYNKNYFLYHSRKTGKWHIVPFDFDLTQGRTYDPDLAYPRNVLNDGFCYWYPLEQGAANPLHLKALRNPVLYERMRQRMAELMDETPDPTRPWRGWLSSDAVERRIDALHAALLPLWAQDPFLKGKIPEVEESVMALRHYYAMRRAFLRRTVVEGPPGHGRDVAERVLPPVGRQAEFVDDGGFVLASVKVRSLQPPTRKTVRSGSVSITVTHAAPRQLPPGARAKACVQRSWYITSWANAELDATFEYQQDSVRTSEVGSKVSSEHKLSLFLQYGDLEQWRKLPTAVNAVANSLSTQALPLVDGESVVLVACTA